MATAVSRLDRRAFGRTGLKVSPLGYSANPFGPRGLPSKGGKLAAADIERAFFEHGINTFLVSPGMDQLAEALRRLIRAGHRDELVLASGGGIPTGWGVRRGLEKILASLGTDHLDVWLLGWVRAHWHVTGKTWPTMRKLKEEGKARLIGFSCHDRPLALSLRQELAPDVMMLRYNAAHRGAERQLFDLLGPERPAIITYTATRWTTLLLPLPDKGFPRAMTGAECYRFVLAHPSVDVAMCAAATPAELEDDVAGVLVGPLEAARLEEVLRFGDAVHSASRGGARFMFRQG